VRCLSVRLSVTFVYCIETNSLKLIVILFFNHLYDSHVILVFFSYKTLWQYSDWDFKWRQMQVGYEQDCNFLSNMSLYLGSDARQGHITVKRQ